MERFTLAIVLFVLGVGFLPAQEKEVPARTLRILAVGDSPPFRQEIRNGIRYELPPPEGSVPPIRVQAAILDAEGAEQKSEYEIDNPKEPGLRLRLNNVTSRLTVPGAALSVTLLDDGTSWHQFQLPEGGDYLLVLFRDPQLKSWGKARSILVPDGGSSFGAGDMRFINVGPVNTAFTIGDRERFELAAGKVLFQTLGVSQGTPAQVMYQDPKRGWQRFWSSALVQNRGERSTIVVYFADGEKPRRPLKLIALRERAVALSKERSTNP
ncbi:hypothetical protein [Roseibacillus persicicus]|uniref:hypothetical protein n=1 Tax=Roseibacillus persicicus TaxID=454148 RepID=UPI00280F0131|nr:hypothetical protein [Roseibacillus persicicus]MDQ8189177.1 hypothetical protein [Roseibacillus persicicus]